MDYTMLQDEDIVAVTAIKTKIPQRILRMISVKKITKEIFLTFLICLILKSTSMPFLKKIEISNGVNRKKTCQIKFWHRFLRPFWYHALLTGFSSMLWLYRNHYIGIANQWAAFCIMAILDPKDQWELENDNT